MKRTLKRRRLENKTNYHKRFKLLKSGKPRVVFRKTNKYIIAQYIESEEAQDKAIFGITSKDLFKNGWPKEAQGSLKSIPASYLTGLLFGKEIQKRKLEKPILDIGMTINLHKTKVYAFLKGLIDAGVELTSSEKKEIFPSEERIQGKDLKNKIKFEEIKSKINK